MTFERRCCPSVGADREKERRGKQTFVPGVGGSMVSFWGVSEVTGGSAPFPSDKVTVEKDI